MMGRLFTIFCLQCKRETMAEKHTRRRVSGTARWEAADTMLFGINRCLTCGELYDAPWPGEYAQDQDDDGERGQDVPAVVEDSPL
jgi:hypothetical protein